MKIMGVGLHSAVDMQTKVLDLFVAGKSKALKRIVVVIPNCGFSERQRPSGPFHYPEGRAFFIKSLQKHLHSNVKVNSLDAHISARIFSETDEILFDKIMKELEKNDFWEYCTL